MATKITVGVRDDSVDGGPKAFFVQEPFDTVLEKIVPTQPPGSALQHREGMVYTRTNGKRMMLNSDMILYVEEDEEEDD